MKFERGKQPKCGECSHSKSFHGGDKEQDCKAMGCDCPKWVEPEVSEESPEPVEATDGAA